MYRDEDTNRVLIREHQAELMRDWQRANFAHAIRVKGRSRLRLHSLGRRLAHRAHRRHELEQPRLSQ